TQSLGVVNFSSCSSARTMAKESYVRTPVHQARVGRLHHPVAQPLQPRIGLCSLDRVELERPALAAVHLPNPFLRHAASLDNREVSAPWAALLEKLVLILTVRAVVPHPQP